GCVRRACQIAALTQGRDLLLRNPDAETARARENLVREKSESDFWVLLRAWEFTASKDFRAEACEQVGIHAATARQAASLFRQFLEIARRVDGGMARCELAHGRGGMLDRQSAVRRSPVFVAAEIRELEGKEKEVNT